MKYSCTFQWVHLPYCHFRLSSLGDLQKTFHCNYAWYDVIIITIIENRINPSLPCSLINLGSMKSETEWLVYYSQWKAGKTGWGNRCFHRSSDVVKIFNEFIVPFKFLQSLKKLIKSNRCCNRKPDRPNEAIIITTNQKKVIITVNNESLAK